MVHARRFAVIDIGSNSVHLLVADSDGAVLRTFLDRRRYVNLGAEVRRTHRIGRVLSDKALRAVAEFVADARQSEASAVRIMATHAVRSATDAAEFARAVKRATGIGVDVIPAGQEAMLAFHGARHRAFSRAQVVVDIGGGSTQVAVEDGEGVYRTMSLAVGSGTFARSLSAPTVRDSAWDSVAVEIERLAAPGFGDLAPQATPGGPALVLAGGAVRKMARLVDRRGAPTEVGHQDLRSICELLRGDSAAVARGHGIHDKRLPTVRGGALLAESLARRLSPTSEWIGISQGGLREGAILEMARRGQACDAVDLVSDGRAMDGTRAMSLRYA